MVKVPMVYEGQTGTLAGQSADCTREKGSRALLWPRRMTDAPTRIIIIIQTLRGLVHIHNLPQDSKTIKMLTRSLFTLFAALLVSAVSAGTNAEGLAFLAAKGKEDGVVTLPSGLLYKGTFRSCTRVHNIGYSADRQEILFGSVTKQLQSSGKLRLTYR